MPTYKVKLADQPTCVLAGLAARSVPWTTLRDELGATSADLNLLTDLDLIERDRESEVWRLTDDGRRVARKAGIPVTASGREDQA